MARYGYVTTALATTILTGCGAEDQLTFQARTTDIQSCITGDWREESTNEADYELPTGAPAAEPGTIRFTDDGYVQVLRVWYNSYTDALWGTVLHTFWSIFLPTDPEELEYEPFTASVSVFAWKTRDDLLLMSDKVYGGRVYGKTENEAMDGLISSLEPATWDTSTLIFKGYNIHCDENFTSEVVSSIYSADRDYVENYILVSENPLTYANDYREYQAGGSDLLRQSRSTLTLNDDGTFIMAGETTYPDYPSRDSSGSISGEYQYDADQVVFTFPSCESCAERRLYDRGTVLTESAIYMERE
jgi:hypothetical protein